MPRITEKHVERIEQIIAESEKFVEPQKSFILPGGSREAALPHIMARVENRRRSVAEEKPTYKYYTA